ncbi:MAG: preprotein translocase subunit YajC [Flavobacteriales bacterium]|nr:preprotein translocase subunit YajC [Flavobacteriales bacterium]MBK7555312.1 preprotein translocase subunit YajC [Flavobacteriales bacterium]MBP6573449.1 preprotein translocase subunit YajC [Flavobacteriales bacterium]
MNILLQAAAPQQESWPTFVMMGLLMVVFYFFMIRPQQKKAKTAKKFREALQKGTRVVTIGGMHGKVVEVDDKTVLLDVDTNVKLRFEKSAIAMDSSMQLTEETKK